MSKVISELLDRVIKKKYEKPSEKDGYAAKSPDEEKFKEKHVVDKKQDANGNDDDLFNADNVKPVNRQPAHGYNPGEDVKVYEEFGYDSTPKEDYEENGQLTEMNYQDDKWKLMKTYPAQSDQHATAKVYKNMTGKSYRSNEPWHMQVIKNGKVHEPGESFADDEEDIHAQAQSVSGHKGTSDPVKPWNESVQIDENLRLMGKHENGPHMAKVYKDHEWGGYRIKFFSNGKHHGEDHDGFADHLEDAHETAKQELKVLGKRMGESLEEALNPSMGAAAYIDHFVHSTNPKFKDASTKQRIKQAVAAFYSGKRA